MPTSWLSKNMPLTWALTAVVLISASDALLGPNWVLTPLLVAGPLVAAVAGPPRHSAYAGVAGVACAFVLGFTNDVEFSRLHYLGVLAVLMATVLGYELARRREHRESQLTLAKPTVEQATRLVRAIHAGHMGEWRFVISNGLVHYDSQVVRILGGGTASSPTGLAPTGLTLTGLTLTGMAISRWLEVVDERDREVVVREVGTAIEGGSSFRFDLRCTWPDGSTHWLEVVGEPTYDEHGVVGGVQGLVWNVDERYEKLEERARLLDVERYARLRAEYLARAHDALSRAEDVEEILREVTRAAVPDLADWCNAVFVADRSRGEPLIVSAHRDPEMESWGKDVLTRFPYNPDANFGAARVIRDGRREVIERVPSNLPLRTDEQREVLLRGGVDSIVTVPVVGPLGLLGALQMIRGRQRDAFTAADVELAEELASRCGSALNSAVLLARQRTSSEALETLQRVSGYLARAATRLDVASATVTHGADGLRADGGCVFVFDDDGALTPLSSVWTGIADHQGWLRSYAEQAVQEDRLTIAAAGSDPPRTVLAAPLHILGRVSGVLLFVFGSCREFVSEELAMVMTLASRCAGALERASLYERERASALVLQHRLLPQIPSIPAWLEVGYCYEPAAGERVGGDWFQLINLDDERVVAVVGDAVGHGVEAAATMGQLKSSIATAVSINPDPAELLRTVDRFVDAAAMALAATAVATMLDRRGECQVASAGHVPPVLLRPGGTTEVLEGGRRPLLGYGDGRSSAAAQRCLTVGDMMVLYSDGLVERRHEVIDVGIDRLRRMLIEAQHLAPQQMCEQLVDRLSGDGGTDDDIALLLLRYVGDAEVSGQPITG